MDWICPQCLMRWPEDIGKCPCAMDSLKPPFVTRVETFLKAIDLDWFQWQVEDYCEMPWKDQILAEIEQLKKEKEALGERTS